jgi:hypothetical protein
VPYAIDFLNPAPDFERDRITQQYFDVLDECRSSCMTCDLWRRTKSVGALGTVVGWATAAGVIGQPA